MRTAASSLLTSAWNYNNSGAGGGEMHAHNRRATSTHMTFSWGHKTEILFSGWPGDSSAMYALAIIFVFFLAVAVEWFIHAETAPAKPGSNRVASGFFKTGLHAVRSGLSYMVVLSVMSFNGGVFLSAVGGHAVGFCIFGSRVFNKKPAGSGS